MLNKLDTCIMEGYFFDRQTAIHCPKCNFIAQKEMLKSMCGAHQNLTQRAVCYYYEFANGTMHDIVFNIFHINFTHMYVTSIYLQITTVCYTRHTVQY